MKSIRELISNAKAVFFDAGGTLFRPFPSVGEIYAEVGRRHGLDSEPARLEQLFHRIWEERDGLASLASHSNEKKEREWWHSLVRDVFSQIGGIKNFEAFFDELYDRFARAESWHLYPDTLPVLKSLKQSGKILGVVSNWDSRLFTLCEGLELKGYFHFILASAVVGAAKPSPKIFQEALKKAGVEPREAVHIGDSLEDDVAGAGRAGIPAIFLDRRGNRTSRELTISSLQLLSAGAEPTVRCRMTKRPTAARRTGAE